VPEANKAKRRDNYVPDGLSKCYSSFFVKEMKRVKAKERKNEEDTKSECCHCFLEKKFHLQDESLTH